MASLLNSHPAQCNKLTAGKIGPLFKLGLAKATPQDTPFYANDKVPLFIFKQTPITP